MLKKQNLDLELWSLVYDIVFYTTSFVSSLRFDSSKSDLELEETVLQVWLILKFTCFPVSHENVTKILYRYLCFNMNTLTEFV